MEQRSSKMQEEPQESQSTEEPGIPEVAEITTDVRNMATLCHILGLVGFIGPLVIWLLKKNDHDFVDQQGKRALNFQFTMLICMAAAYVFMGIFLNPDTAVIGYVALMILIVVNYILTIGAALKTSKALPGNYPVSIRFLV
jgi:uncharacterized Tic20 family protein